MVVQFTLPYAHIPLRLEATTATVDTLIATSQNYFAQLVAYFSAKTIKTDAQIDSTQLIKIKLYSALKLLNVNINNLVTGTSSEEYMQIINNTQRETLRHFLFTLLDSEMIVADKKLEMQVQLLFVTCIDLLYPTSASQVALLAQYIDKYSNGSITNTEMFLLEFVLNIMSKPVTLAKLVTAKNTNTTTTTNNSSDSNSVNASMKLFTSLELILKGEITQQYLPAIANTINNTLNNTTSSTNSNGSSSSTLGKAVVQTMSTLCKLLLSKASQPFLTSSNGVVASATSTNNTVIQTNLTAAERDNSKLAFQLVLSLTTLCCDILKLSAVTNNTTADTTDIALNNNKNTLHTLNTAIDSMLKTSPVGSLLPFVLNVVTNLITLRGYTLLHNSMDILHEIIAVLTSCHTQLSGFIAMLPSEQVLYSDVIKEVSSALFCV